VGGNITVAQLAASDLSNGTNGTGAVSLTTSPTFVTPVLGAATATSLQFSPSTGGIIGTTTNNNADAGKVGEVISSTVLAASSVPLTTNTIANITSISLTAGDWDVSGNVFFNASSGCTYVACWSSSTSATQPDNSEVSGTNEVLTTMTVNGWCVPTKRYSLSGTTTVYLSCISTFAAGTNIACGNIFGRRAR
jgi:hypothetical protein